MVLLLMLLLFLLVYTVHGRRNTESSYYYINNYAAAYCFSHHVYVLCFVVVLDDKNVSNTACLTISIRRFCSLLACSWLLHDDDCPPRYYDVLLQFCYWCGVVVAS